MAKDPAFLFYSNDFLSGTFTMSDEQVGKYIRLLCLQHQKYELSEKDMLNICKSYDEDIYCKFTVIAGKYFNERLRNEAERRKAYSLSRKENRESTKNSLKVKKEQKNGKTVSKSYVKHMETETEIETEIEIENDTELKATEKKIDFDLILSHWNNFAKEMKLPEIKAITDERKKKILTRNDESNFDFEMILTEIKRSDFLLGRVNDFKVSFDWIFKSPKNYLKIIEGNYKNGKSANNNAGSSKGFDLRKNSWIESTLKNAILITGKDSN